MTAPTTHITGTVTDGLWPGPDGTYIGLFRDVPLGWEWSTSLSLDHWWKHADELDGPVDDAPVLCRPVPDKPRTETERCSECGRVDVPSDPTPPECGEYIPGYGTCELPWGHESDCAGAGVPVSPVQPQDEPTGRWTVHRGYGVRHEDGDTLWCHTKDQGPSPALATLVADALNERVALRDSWPDPHDFIAQLREAVGLFVGALPVPPKVAWDEAVAVARRAVQERDEYETENTRLRDAIKRILGCEGQLYASKAARDLLRAALGGTTDEPTTERCPACWGTGWRCDCHQLGNCAECNDHDCSLTGCPICTPFGGVGGVGRCNPIPARGQQAVPWEWTSVVARVDGALS